MEDFFESFEQNQANYVPLSPLSFLSRAQALHGERTAVISGELRRTWSELTQRVQLIASNFSHLDIGKGDTVSVLSSNIPELFELHFALPLSGAVMNTLNTRLDPETIAYILDHADTKIVIVEQQFVSLLDQAFELMNRKIPAIVISGTRSTQDNPYSFGSPGKTARPTDYEDLLIDNNETRPLDGPSDEWQSIALNYTSGTSGRPKGVICHHRGAYLMALGTVAAWQMPHYPIYLSVVPMFHCNGWGHPWVMAILGGTMVFSESAAPDQILDAIGKHKVTHFGAAPIILQMLAEQSAIFDEPFDPPVRVLTAGAPPPPSVLKKTTLMGFEVMQVYGLTETYGHITQCLWQEAWSKLPKEEQARLQAQQGIAFPMVESVKVINAETGKEVAHDGTTQGEITIRGNTVMKGYYKDQDATSQAFKNGWFWSGDAAVVFPDGYIQIRDRLKDVIISGGENISSVEVEAVLYRHPAIQAAAVVAKTDAQWGEVPCAFVELREGKQAETAEIITFCRKHLAGFKTPKTIVFTDLPKTSTGKIQKFKLRKIARSGNF